MIFAGVTLPVAPAAYTVTELFPSKFAMYTLPLPSTATSTGSFKPVLEPAIVWIGFAFPFASAA